jgi:hypothetical protein
VSAAASTYYGFMAMKVDPKDPRVPSDNDTHHAPRIDPEEPTKQCWICDIQVGEQSMHCKFCNKCVDHFDHHCMCKLYHEMLVFDFGISVNVSHSSLPILQEQG